MDISEVINKYIKISDIERTGLVLRGIEKPENVSTHELSCQLIALASLFDGCDLNGFIENDEEVNLFLILLLILIHDLGEVDIGDKVRGTKTAEEKKCEHLSIQNFLHSINQNNTNSALCDLLDKLWADMESGNAKNVNARIAKEIDYIQGAYQYFRYCISDRVKFTRESCFEWLNEISDDRIKTPQGKKMRDGLILNNADFVNHKTLGKYFIDFKS